MDAVGDALIPSFFSGRPTLTPGVFMSSTKAVIPLCFFSLSVTANSTQ